jgi:hypothetical protein
MGTCSADSGDCYQYSAVVVRGVHRAGFYGDDLVVLMHEYRFDWQWFPPRPGSAANDWKTHRFFEVSSSGERDISVYDYNKYGPTSPTMCNGVVSQLYSYAYDYGHILDVHFQSKAYTIFRYGNVAPTWVDIPVCSAQTVVGHTSEVQLAYRVGNNEVVAATVPIAPVSVSEPVGVGGVLPLHGMVGRIQGIPYCPNEPARLKALFFGSSAYTYNPSNIEFLTPNHQDAITLVCATGTTDVTPIAFGSDGTVFTDFGVF